MMDLSQFDGHTPGLWSPGHFCREDHFCDCRYIFGGDRMGAIATVHYSDAKHEPNGDNPPPAEAKANMRLIAAAPELLAEVKRLREQLAWYTTPEIP